MRSCRMEAARLVREINTLREPYRQHAKTWLRAYTRAQGEDLFTDVDHFLQDLDPLVRNYFVRSTWAVLQEAAQYFRAKE